MTTGRKVFFACMAIIALIAIMMIAHEPKQITEGRFNSNVEFVQPDPEPPPHFNEPDWFRGVHPEPTTTTTTIPTKKIYRQPEAPTPFEEGRKTSKPWGCDEGEVRGVDC